MTKVDCIKKLADSYKQELEASITNPDKEYVVTSAWLVKQYLTAFTEGLTKGLNYNVILRSEHQQMEQDGVDVILKKVFDSNDSYKELAHKVNMDG